MDVAYANAALGFRAPCTRRAGLRTATEAAWQRNRTNTLQSKALGPSRCLAPPKCRRARGCGSYPISKIWKATNRPINTASWPHCRLRFPLIFKFKALFQMCYVPFQALYVLLGSELRPIGQLGDNEAGLRFRHLRLAQGFVG